MWWNVPNNCVGKPNGQGQQTSTWQEVQHHTEERESEYQVYHCISPRTGIIQGRCTHESKIHIEMVFAFRGTDSRTLCRALLDRRLFLMVDVVERMVFEVQRYTSDATGQHVELMNSRRPKAKKPHL